MGTTTSLLLSYIIPMINRHHLTLSGWQGGTSALHVDAESKRRVFLPLKDVLTWVELVLPGHPVRPRCRLTRTFWTTCPELRSGEIGRWMENRGDKPWPRGSPPRYSAYLVLRSGNTTVIRVLV